MEHNFWPIVQKWLGCDGPAGHADFVKLRNLHHVGLALEVRVVLIMCKTM